MARGVAGSSVVSESVYIVRSEISLEALASSLQALLPSRHYPIVRRRFTVLDTFDGRIRRAGARLTRTGVNGSCTMVWQADGGRRHLVVRASRPVGFAWDVPDSPLQRVLESIIGVRRLIAQADAEKYGSLLDVLDARRKIVARLRIESGRARLAMARSAWQSLPTFITLTSLRGYEGVYRRLVPVIESRPGVEPWSEGLDDVMLRQVGAPAGHLVSSPLMDLDRTVSADHGARQIHLGLLRLLALNEPGLRASLDTEFLHDFRVTVRRTRSLLRQIRHVFPPSVVNHFSIEFSWIGRLTGPLRDIEVLLLALRERPEDTCAGDMELLTAVLGQSRRLEHQKLVEALDSDRYRKLLSDWEEFLTGSETRDQRPRNAERPLAHLISRRASRLSERIADGASSVDKHTDAVRLHELRIQAKKLRYLLDATPGLFDRVDLEVVLGALKKLQRVLGDFNDAQVQESRLLECAQELGDGGAPASALLAVGRLAEQCRHRREVLRDQIVDGITRFRAHDTRSACRRVFRDRATARDRR
jgi:CHAD domain-containing protein